MRRKKLWSVLKAAGLLLWLPVLLAPQARAQEEIFRVSGAEGIFDALDRESQELLEEAGAGEGRIVNGLDQKGALAAVSNLVRDKLTAPLKALAALLGICLLCRLAGCWEDGELSGWARLIGSAACGVVMAGPVSGLISACQGVSKTASAFLAASVPVYGGLLAASGSPVSGSGYSLIAMGAGSAIPVLASGIFVPLLRVYLGLAVASAISGTKLQKLTASLYSFNKWALVTAVTVFTAVLSLQSAVNGQVDAAAGKAAKLAVSSGIPIVGGALGDAVGAIQNSVHIVKSGVGAFGILAAVCVFLPLFIECLLWSGICLAGQLAGDLLEASGISGILGAFSAVVKMVLAILASICAVCVASAAAVVFAWPGG